MNTTTAQTIENVDNLDLLATTSIEVQAAKLAECMVLMDPETGTPAVWLDHKLTTTRNSGEVTWMAHDLETGRLITIRLRSTLAVSVMAA